MTRKTIPIFFFVFLLVVGIASANLNDGILHFYTHNDDDVIGTTVVDVTGNLNGTITGSVFNFTGVIEESLDFQGTSDYYTLGNSQAEPAEITVAFWINPDTLILGDAHDHVVDLAWDPVGVQGGFAMIITDADDKLGCWIGDGTNFNQSLYTTNVVNSSQWQFFACTYNSTGGAVLYRNGQIDNSFTWGDGSIGASAGNWVVATKQDNFNAREVDGKIDAVGIWNRSLSDVEILELYNSGAGLEYPFNFTQNLTDILSYFSLDNADLNGLTVIDLVGNYNASNHITHTAESGVPGKIKQGFLFNGSDTAVAWAAAIEDAVSVDGKFTFSTWFRTNDTVRQVLFGSNTVSGDDSIALNLNTMCTGDDVNDISIRYKSNGTNSCRFEMTNEFNFTDGEWHHIVFVGDTNCDASNTYFYIDGVDRGTTACGASDNVSDIDTLNVWFGSWYNTVTNPVRVFNGSMDEILWANSTYTAEQVATLYNGGDGYNPFARLPEINVTNLAPANNTQFNTNSMKINFTVQSPQVVYTCNLYINNSFNQSLIGVLATDNHTFNVTFADGAYNYNITCDSTNYTGDSETNHFYIDTIDPITNTTYANNSAFLYANTNFEFNFSDEQSLYSVLINISNGTNNYIIENATNISSKTYNVLVNISPRSLVFGKHNMTVRYADGHTANYISAYDVDKSLLGNSITYEKKGWEVQINPTSIGSFDTTRLTDRYTFTHKPTFNNDYYEYEITSDKPITIMTVKDSKIGTWLITGERWIDFYIPTQPKAEVSYRRINDFLVVAKVSGLTNKDEIVFNSIGELNIVTETYNLATLNGTVTYQQAVNENNVQSITFRINKTDDVTSTAASLEWNGTTKSVVKTTTATYDLYNATFTTPDVDALTTVNFTWFYNITAGNFLSESLNFSQTINYVNLDNCTSGNVSVNITSYQAANPTTLQNADIDVWFNYTYGNASVDFFFSKNLNTNNVLICLNPPNQTISGNLLVDFQGTGGYAKQNYWVQNLTVDGFSNYQIALYNQLTNNVSNVNIFLTDQNDQVLDGWQVRVLRFDVGRNQYLNTENLITDANGQVVANIILNTQRYRFIIVDPNGVVRRVVNQEEVYTQNLFFVINLEEDVIQGIYDELDVTGIVSFDNSTKDFSFTWVDNNNVLSQACLDTRTLSAYGIVSQNITCSSASTGIITYNVGASPTGRYQGVGYIIPNGDTKKITLDTEEFDFSPIFQNWGLLGIFLTMILCIILFGAGMWNPVVAIVLATLGLIISFMIGMISLSFISIVGISVIAGIIVFKIRT